ncbi:MAG: hypothetical protein FJW26_11045 [Acidimicrobiia bacterium]|nr:hypothetical protein [Acidimicrobiia bacterium]
MKFVPVPRAHAREAHALVVPHAVRPLEIGHFSVLRLAEEVTWVEVSAEVVQPGASFVEHSRSGRNVCLTRPLEVQALLLPTRGPASRAVVYDHGCRRGRLRSQGGFTLLEMSSLQVCLPHASEAM